jgi:hypothetical protein
MQKQYRLLVTVYLFISIAVPAQLIFLYLTDPASLSSIAALGPMTKPWSLIIGLLSVWLAAGIMLFAAAWDRINKTNVFLFATFFIVAVAYAGFLRERLEYGDVNDYIHAANAIVQGSHFDGRYVYPPLWASILSIFHSAGGTRAAYFVCYAVNSASLWLFFFLAVAWLRRFGLSLNAASLVVFCALIINAPVLRNLVYVQVNLLVASAMLGCLLLYPRFPIWSAVVLAIGTHMKVVPLLFVPLFFGKHGWKWYASFVLTMASIVALTTFKDGFSYYSDFIANITSFGGEVTPRSSSIDCWLQLILDHTFGSHNAAGALSVIIKGCLCVSTCVLAFISIKRKSFVSTSDMDSDRVMNGSVPLFFLTVIVPPTVWVYHLTWLIPAVLVLALTLRNKTKAVMFASAYFAVFLLPAFDLYPWSILRLLGWLGLYAIAAGSVLHPGRGDWVDKLANARCSLM